MVKADIEEEHSCIAAMSNDDFWSHYVDVIETEENDEVLALYEAEGKRRRQEVY